MTPVMQRCTRRVGVPRFWTGAWLEAVTLLCKLAFRTFGAQRVSIQCEAANTRSANTARRLGFVHEATLRNHSRNTMGELTDTLVFALTPDDYDLLQWPQV